MTHELDAMSAIMHAQIAVKKELDELHMDKRDRDAVIENQQKQIKSLRQSTELADERKNRAYETADASIVVMYFSIVAAFIAIGYAVWIGQ